MKNNYNLTYNEIWKTKLVGFVNNIPWMKRQCKTLKLEANEEEERMENFVGFKVSFLGFKWRREQKLEEEEEETIEICGFQNEEANQACRREQKLEEG